jgi:hypothetical protein
LNFSVAQFECHQMVCIAGVERSGRGQIPSHSHFGGGGRSGEGVERAEESLSGSGGERARKKVSESSGLRDPVGL